MRKLKTHPDFEFEINDPRALGYFLGIEVACSENGSIVSKRNYILDLLKERGIRGCRPSHTPIDPNLKFGDNNKEVPVDIGRYQALVGKLIYLSHTRPVASLVSVVSQFMYSPEEEHLEAIY